jgi:hypothetical protein
MQWMGATEIRESCSSGGSVQRYGNFSTAAEKRDNSETATGVLMLHHQTTQKRKFIPSLQTKKRTFMPKTSSNCSSH